jgi:hypothetical protein
MAKVDKTKDQMANSQVIVISAHQAKNKKASLNVSKQSNLNTTIYMTNQSVVDSTVLNDKELGGT